MKWKGLGYGRATWELETASFLKSPEASKLMRDFETRHKNAKIFNCDSGDDKVHSSSPLISFPNNYICLTLLVIYYYYIRIYAHLLLCLTPLGKGNTRKWNDRVSI